MRGLYGGMMEYVLYGGICPYLGRTINATGSEPMIGHIIDRFHNRLCLLQSNYIVQYNQLSVSYRPRRSAHPLVSLVGVPHRSRQFHPNHQIQLRRAIS